MADVLAKLAHGCSNVGIVNAVEFLWKAHVVNPLYMRVNRAGGYRWTTLSTRQMPHAVTCRYGSTDFKVFNQIFFQDEYGPIKVRQEPRLIVDCGAYAGFSTSYFLAKYPKAEVIAVEPDGRNFAVLTQNVAKYGSRVKTINAALWSHPAKLTLQRGARGEWSNVVRECRDGEPVDLEAIDMSSVLQQSSHGRVDILKVDIEGAERAVFGRNFETWIDRVDTLVIELHGSDCEEIVRRALSGVRFDYSESGELTIAQRRDAPS